MTAGHKHWIGAKVRRGGLAMCLLRVPVWRCRDMAKVDASRFPYTGRTPDDIEPDEHGYWHLTLLGLLHGLTGFTVEIRDE